MNAFHQLGASFRLTDPAKGGGGGGPDPSLKVTKTEDLIGN